MISPVAVGLARLAFFLDVVHVTIRGELAVATHDAATVQCGESEKPNKTTHTSLRAALKHFPYLFNLRMAAMER